MGPRENPKMKTQEAETPESTTLFKIFCEQGGQGCLGSLTTGWDVYGFAPHLSSSSHNIAFAFLLSPSLALLSLQAL